MKRSSRYLPSLVLASLVIGVESVKAQSWASAASPPPGAVYNHLATTPPKDVLKKAHVIPQADVTVTGRVTGETGGGLPGVTVMLKGTSTGVTTDVDGNYRLAVPEGRGTLVFISNATPATRTIFPIPQAQLNANPNLEQNPGY